MDNTVLDFSTAEEKSLFRAFRDIGVLLTDDLLAHFRRINDRCWEMLEEGKLTRRQVLVGRFEKLFEEEKIAADAESVQNSYEEYLCSGHFFMPGAEQLLSSLQDFCRLFIVSNGNTLTQDRRIASSGIAPYFEDIFISETIGFQKPGKEFFDYCFSRIPGFDASLAVIVGDSLTSDIRGGINAGITTVWYNYLHKPVPGTEVPDHTITELSQLPALLKTVFSLEEM